ncbi:MAG TPA: hypothetical protein VGZ32_20375 [Actinocrinis sp.]|uniref:hypothetical protein n=1 Tax=Actinocrinis sp. TaxID=1920516 RepID=UPI002DDD4983|nr:hypothetical protein [Actinocrinis sp.]HEV3172714.1 hypothetical protein [Actinocrinis sp.]
MSANSDEFSEVADRAPPERYIVLCPACEGDGRVIPPGSLAQVSCRLCWERGRVSRIVANKYLRSHDKRAG